MKTALHILLTLLFLLTLGGQPAADPISDEKREDIKRLLDVTGALAIGKQLSDSAVEHMTRQLKASRPDLPTKLFDILQEEVNGVIDENLQLFVELVIPLYHRHFSHAEIQGLIAFYQSELGRKAVLVMPVLMQESMSVGRQWGRALAPEIERRVLRRFRVEGFDLEV